MTLRELLKILRNAEKISDIDKYRDKIVDLIPKIAIMVNYDQQNYAHQYNLWEHCLHTVVGLPKDIEDDMVYLAALLHDIGKPYCCSVGDHDGKVNMHYYGHPECSMKIVRDEVIPNLTEKGEVLIEDEKRRLIYYVEYHDDRVSLKVKHLKRHLKLGVSLKEFQTLMKLQVSDAKAHVLIPGIQERIEICEKLSGEYSEKSYNIIKKENL